MPDVVVFEGLELNRATRRLSCAGRPIPLQPKLYELLCILIDRNGRVVTKDELLDLLWPGEHVVPEVLTTAMRGLRTALGDTGSEQRFIRTVRNAGYQFVAPVKTVTQESPASRVRHESFVGRHREIELFERMLTTATTRMLFVHGPGGIGKTSVLQEQAYRCAQRGLAHVQINAEHVVARPGPFEDALKEALGCAGGDLYRVLRDAGELVLFIDNFDLLAGLGSWFMDVFLPRVPERVSVVLASRAAPRSRWIADPAWVALVDDILLAPFDEGESRHFLASRGVAPVDTEAILRFTKGLPLALAVAAAAVERGARADDLPKNRGVIDALVEVFTDRAPTNRHRQALEIASLLSSFNEALLASLLETDDVADLYTWISGLSFVRHVPAGLQVHSLVRDSLLAHLRWRNPDRLGALAARCYALHFKLLEDVRDPTVRITLTNRIMSLGRHHPTLRPFYTYDDLPNVSVELATKPSPLTATMLARHEGEESAAIFSRWVDLQLGDLWLARDDDEVPAGIALVLSLPIARLDELSWDPAVRAIRHYLGTTPGGAADDHIVVYRYLVARDTYQAVSPVMQRCHEILNYDLHTLEPNVSYSFNVYGEPEIWAPVNAFAEFQRLHGCDFEIAGRRFGVFGHSWREMPLHTWADAIARKLASGAMS